MGYSSEQFTERKEQVMQYLTIKNAGVCPIEGFTVLGVSTARGNNEAIGQFGSGAKHGMLTCLRMGVNPVVYLGHRKLQFHTEPATMEGTNKTYNKVFCKDGTKAPKELSIALEYGALDWDGVEMALREFISNALDAVGGDPSKVEFKVVEQIHPDDNATIVGVPMTPEVQRFYSELGDRFLQFNGDKTLTGKKFIPKQKPGPARIYRKGVFIRRLGGANSLYDYNFGEELQIDESRNLDDYSAKNAIAQALVQDADTIARVLSASAQGTAAIEVELGDNFYIKYYAQQKPATFTAAWKKAFGDTAVVGAADAITRLGSAATAKGYKPVSLNNSGWMGAMTEAKVPTLFGVLDDVNDKGHKILHPTPAVLTTQKVVWDFLVAFDLTKGKDMPPCKMYQEIMNGGSETLGYYKDGTVFIQVGRDKDKKVMLEELAHYITGANDATRDFQDYAFRVAATLME